MKKMGDMQNLTAAYSSVELIWFQKNKSVELVKKDRKNPWRPRAQGRAPPTSGILKLKTSME